MWITNTFDLDAFSVAQTASCVLGIPYVFLSWFFARIVSRTRWERFAVAGILLTSGGVQLYFGYGEDYARVPVFLLGFVCLGIQALRKQGPALAAIGFWILAMASHSFMIALVPGGMYLTWQSIPDERRIRCGLPILGGILFFTLLVLNVRMGYDTRVNPVSPFLQLFSTLDHPHSLLSVDHIWERLNGVLLTSPFAVPIICLGWPELLRRIRSGNRSTRFLAIVALSFLGSTSPRT